MGRKIPVRKHKGVRDPEEQRRRREAPLKGVTNNPPRDIDDDQPLPKSVLEMNKLREMVKEGKFKAKEKPKKRKKKDDRPRNFDGTSLLNSADFVGPQDRMLPGMKRPEKGIPTIQQRPGEKDRSFLWRLTQLCDDVVKETKFEKQYNVDVVRNLETGQVEGIKKKKKDEVDEMLAQEMKKARETKNSENGKKSKKKLKDDVSPNEEKVKRKMDRWKIRREKMLKKALKKNEEKMETIRETFKFGEVADRPPELMVRPRKAGTEKDLKNLMFNQMIIQGKKAENEKKGKKTGINAEKNAGKPVTKSLLSGKRKDLPVGERRMLEEQQKAVIAAYRIMKAKKTKQQ